MRMFNNAFVRLAISMVGFGLAIGVVFPFAVLEVGVSRSLALSPHFFAFTLAAGLAVGGANIFLARMLVRPRLKLLASRMSQVELGITDATFTGDWSKCDPEECSIPEDTDDEFGEAAGAFNRLIQALSDSHQMQHRLSSFTEGMSSELEVGDLSATALAHFRRDLGASSMAVIGHVGGELELLASHALEEPDRLLSNDMVLRALRTGETEYLPLAEGLVIDAGVSRLRPRAVVVHPLRVNSAPIGVVVLAHASEPSPATRSLAPTLMRTFAVALSNALTHQSIQRLAALDPLTGLYNRRFGLGRLHEEYVRSVRTGSPLGVVMVDIDHFKRFNDTHGHVVGDAVLKAVASEARSALREGDILVRYGGEELLAVLPGAGYDDSAGIAERVRRLVEATVLTVGNQELRVTVSTGFGSTAHLAVQNEMDLVEKADGALFEAKRSGRNRTAAAAS